MKINRRGILKIGAGAFLSALLNPFVLAQPQNSLGAIPGEISSGQVNGNISYNAGWVIPLEDKQALLELEAKKTKEREDLSKQKSDIKSVDVVDPKENSKSLSKRFQGILDKVKGLF